LDACRYVIHPPSFRAKRRLGTRRRRRRTRQRAPVL